jgi:hypothetical protein
MLVLPLGLCKAQTAPAKPVEPTAIGVVYLLDPTTQELKKLPDEQWKQDGGQHPGLASFVEVVGNQSSIRIKAGEATSFVFKTGSPEKVSLYLFLVKKNKRYFEFEKRNRTGVTPIKGLPVEVSKFGEDSYKLVPASTLAPGEYAINIAGEVYTFGVD